MIKYNTPLSSHKREMQVVVVAEMPIPTADTYYGSLYCGGKGTLFLHFR